MSAYRRILIAVDLSEDSHAVGARALQVAAPGAALRLLHVVEFVPIEPMSDSLVPVVQIDDQMVTRAREQLGELARELGLSADAICVETGNVSTRSCATPVRSTASSSSSAAASVTACHCSCIARKTRCCTARRVMCLPFA